MPFGFPLRNRCSPSPEYPGSLTIAGKFLYIPRLSPQIQSHARSYEPHFSILLKVDFNRAPCSRVEWGSSEIHHLRAAYRRPTGRRAVREFCRSEKLQQPEGEPLEFS